MSNKDFEIEFSEEFDEEQEEVRQFLEEHNPIGQVTILEHPESGLAAYHTAAFDSPFEGPNGELSDTQMLFENICALIEEYLSASKQ